LRDNVAKSCPYCRGEIAKGEADLCASCGTPHHRECYAENGGCTVFGCDQAPQDEAKIVLGGLGLEQNSEDPAAAAFWVAKGGQQTGPYNIGQVQEYLADGRISPTDLAWAAGMREWLPIGKIPVIRPALANLPHFAHEQRLPQQEAPPPAQPESHLTGAILCSLFCCIPFGIVAIVYASQVGGKFRRGDYAGAQEASRKASSWIKTAIIAGLVVAVLRVLSST
jgi:Interferon-induced transmembrane protein/GYF domain 2/Prokaryotic RING finger family 1